MAVFKKHAINCARKITVFKKYEKNCARNLATTSIILTLFSIILQSEPLMLKHVWGTKSLSSEDPLPTLDIFGEWWNPYTPIGAEGVNTSEMVGSTYWRGGAPLLSLSIHLV